MLGNVLSAAELLVNKGIRHETWERWNKTAEILPSVGQKQYEPNGSWLQKKQIEKGLNDRKELLGVERVERKSQLAAAEWLPQESRARVTKKSGQEWTNFGLEENCQLYLIPEEALLLLELNCLELSWDGIALSVQQAYSIILGSNPFGCTLNEYRVYSHLVRQGYRLQRYRYDNCCMAKDDSIGLLPRLRAFKRKKLIHDPCNGFWLNNDLSGDQAKNYFDHEIIEPEVDDQEAKSNISSFAKISKMSSNDGQGNKMGAHPSCISEEKTISPLLNKENSKSDDTCLKSLKVSASEAYDNGVVNLPGPSKFAAKFDNNAPRSSRLQIISDETFLGDFKIISAWPGSRVQRTVQQFPESLIDGSSSLTIEEVLTDANEVSHSLKISNQMQSSDNSGIKEVFGAAEMDIHDKNVNDEEGDELEVIEVSDDEIQEVPRRMSRMEMLNLLPNCGYTKFVATPILKRYLPPNLNPKRVWQPDSTTKISNVDKCVINNEVHRVSQVNAMRAVDIPGPTSFNGNKHTNHGTTSLLDLLRQTACYVTSSVYDRDKAARPRLFSNQMANQQYCNQLAPGLLSRTTQYFYVVRISEITCWAKRCLRELAIIDSCIRISIPTRDTTALISGSDHIMTKLQDCTNQEMIESLSSFKKISGASSWAETKAKWLEKETITIEDEECKANEETDVKVLAQLVKPLVGPQNASSLAQVYKSLQIIKASTFNNVRWLRKRKQAGYKISYNLYSTAQHFKKSNPGTPMSRIVVCNSGNTPIIELADILRLQNDAKNTPVILACVSETSVNFVEFGRVRIPEAYHN